MHEVCSCYSVLNPGAPPFISTSQRCEIWMESNIEREHAVECDMQALSCQAVYTRGLNPRAVPFIPDSCRGYEWVGLNGWNVYASEFCMSGLRDIVSQSGQYQINVDVFADYAIGGS